MSSSFPWKRRCTLYLVGSLIRSNEGCLGRYLRWMIRSGCCILKLFKKKETSFWRKQPNKSFVYMHTSTIRHRHNQCNHIKLNNCRRIFDNKTHQASYEVPRCSQWGLNFSKSYLNFYPVTILRHISYLFHYIKESK